MRTNIRQLLEGEYSTGASSPKEWASALKGNRATEPPCVFRVCNVCRTCLTLKPLGKLIKQLAPSSGGRLSFLLACVNME